LSDLGRFQEALSSYDKALAIRPAHAETLYNSGVVLAALHRLMEARARYDRALALKPDFTDALYNRGVVLRTIGHGEQALADFDRALAVRPNFIQALNNRAAMLSDLKRPRQAMEAYRQILAFEPGNPYVLGGVAGAALNLCDWAEISRISPLLADAVLRDEAVVPPFTLLGYSDDASLQLACARNYLQDRILSPQRRLWDGTIYHHNKIRIAYLSTDFHQHAMAHLLVGLYELHDRSRFEVIGISLGKDDASEMRARLIRAFDQFHDVRLHSDLEVARLLHRLEVDIVIDLNGHTRDARSAILSYRPCPLQVNYLGYPGTTGADFIDYIIADNTVLPFDQAQFFTEKIVHLPDCYQANDSKRTISTATPTRQELGLPEVGFVFCCFNNNWKITAPVFDIWMRLLGSIPGSVLWLIEDSPETRKNLLAEAVARGVDPQRLIFAPRVKMEDHLARHRLADLFLDTLPYNAHTTASDALWAGLPLLTCRGSAFAGRVATSLLVAIGMAELVTGNPQEYEALASKLARNPELLRSLRYKLQQNRLTHSLFDTDRFRRNIEKAYATMWTIYQRGDAPKTLVEGSY
jgi:protein O-GlcNAc transferase